MIIELFLGYLGYEATKSVCEKLEGSDSGPVPTKTVNNWRDGDDEVSEVTFHDTGKTIRYRNGRRDD